MLVFIIFRENLKIFAILPHFCCTFDIFAYIDIIIYVVAQYSSQIPPLGDGVKISSKGTSLKFLVMASFAQIGAVAGS